MVTKVCSFGYKWGEPERSDPRIDVRQAIPNPHNVPRLRGLDGTDLRVAAWLLSTPNFYATYAQLLAQAKRAIDYAMAETQGSQTLWVGCHGGRHRSVYMADRLGRDLGLLVEHRDLGKYQYREGSPS
jgi:UPF0042 nucleotide-binding protein